jgi:hypothetical protein
VAPVTVTLTRTGAAVTHDQKHSPYWQGLTHTGKTNDAGRPIPGRPIIVNCHGHVELGICGDCCVSLGLVLADVPQLFDDLDIAIAGETRFVEHGHRIGGSEPTGSGHPAIAAQQRLTLALIGDGTEQHPGVKDWFDNYGPASLARALTRNLHRVVHEPRMPNLARDITQAASRAHHVIDSPVDLCYYGPCPSCGRDLVQERIWHKDAETKVTCRYPSCDYAEPLSEHQRKLLAASEDRWMTVTELVSAITSADEPVTRDQINWWIKRGGLAREKRVRPRYVNGELTTTEVWTYRLGDVRDRAAAAERRKRPAEA